MREREKEVVGKRLALGGSAVFELEYLLETDGWAGRVPSFQKENANKKNNEQMKKQKQNSPGSTSIFN